MKIDIKYYLVSTLKFPMQIEAYVKIYFQWKVLNFQTKRKMPLVVLKYVYPLCCSPIIQPTLQINNKKIKKM